MQEKNPRNIAFNLLKRNSTINISDPDHDENLLQVLVNLPSMGTCLTMLRGINMTGHNTIKMTGLADMFRQLGYTDAETCIQGGNIVFKCHNGNIEDVSSGIRKAILSEFSLFNKNIPPDFKIVNNA